MSVLAPFLPRVVTIRPAFESFERDYLRKRYATLTYSDRIVKEISLH